jgi:hypothetical protein
MDLEENFTSGIFKEDDYKRNDKKEISPFLPTTNITAENIAMERVFREKVLDWLNNGELKCFKSPTEGNLIIRLTNISLTPNTTVSRMLWQFSATAYEMMEYTPKNLIELFYPDYYKPEIIGAYLPKSSSVLLDFSNNSSIVVSAPIAGVNMNNVKVENCPMLTYIQVNYGNNKTLNYYINSSGNADLGSNIVSLIISKPDNEYLFNKVGSVTFTYDAKLESIFDEINKQEIYSKLGNQIHGNKQEMVANYGIDLFDENTLVLEELLDEEENLTGYATNVYPSYLKYSDNILNKVYDVKRDFNKFLFIRAWKKREIVFYRIKGVENNKIEYYWDRNYS